MNANSAKNPKPRQRYEFVEVRPSDEAGLGAWAERLCRGWTVRDLGSALGVEPTMKAVVNYLAEGLTGEARQAVVEACERELKTGADSENTQAKSPENTKAKYVARMVGDSDADGLARWAELCRGRTVEDLAAELKVEPTIDAIISRLTAGLPEKSRNVVADVCRRELKRKHP